MYTNKYIAICLLSFSLAAIACSPSDEKANTERMPKAEEKVVLAQVQASERARLQQQQVQKQVPAKTRLDSMRIRMKNEYARALPEIKRKPPIVATPPVPPANTQCKSCDIEFLARISKQGEVNQRDFTYLLCTNDKSCQNNVEFLEFYNELLFYYVMRQPLEFLQGFMADSSKWDLVANELAHPVTDEYSTDRVMEVLRATDEEYKGKLRQPFSILQERMKGKAN